MEAPKSPEKETSETNLESATISEDPFKTPAIFAAPSVALKKSKSVQKLTPEPDISVRSSDGQEPSKEYAENDDQSIKADLESPNQTPVTEKPVIKEKQVHAPASNLKKTAKMPPSGTFPPVPYTEPPWAGVPPYNFELLKNGAILDTVPLIQQSYFVVGRLPVCDISLEHPSISRYHAVVQYREKAGDTGVLGEELGFYIYDLGSTHGTCVNKNKIPPKTYIRLHVGHVVKFGGSTRLFILQGPESTLTVTELRERARKQREDLENWMIGDSSYDDDQGHGTWLCKIKLPMDDSLGRQLIAEVTHTGRKKEEAVQCCLDGCRRLVARARLRQEAVSRKRKKKNWEENDYYDSDDGLDITGAVEKKRQERMKKAGKIQKRKERMKKAGKIQKRPETYDSLVAKRAEVEKELAETENTLRSSKKGGSSSATADPLDAFMSSVPSQAAVDMVQRKKLHLHANTFTRRGTVCFNLQGPESYEEELRRRQEVQDNWLMGESSDDDDDYDQDKEEKNEESVADGRSSPGGCSWGMGEDAAPVEDENEENPFVIGFQEDQKAAYLKDPKKGLQGFYDREGEELDFEYDDQGHGTWLCRIKLPMDDSLGRQLIAEVTHTGRKKEEAVQCCLDGCRRLVARARLRQEAVSLKRKKKNWEENDYYDSDDVLDITGAVEKKRQERMKKAGKIQERFETYDSLVAKLAEVEKELAQTENTLRSSEKGGSSSATVDSLDAFMSSVHSQAAVDMVQSEKLRLQKLIKLTRPTELPSLQSRPDNQSSELDKPKKLALPLFGPMKGGKKLKTGIIVKLPPKRPNLPPQLLNMKELPPGGEEEEEEDEQEEKTQYSERPTVKRPSSHGKEKAKSVHPEDDSPSAPPGEDQPPLKKKSGKIIGPSRPPSTVSKQYPEDDPDYCVWVPPAGQTGDGRTHLNDKYGY